MEYTEKVQRSMEQELRDTLTAECQVEYTLPDYLPEIRRILRVEARPIPAGRYLDDNHAELAGLVSFTVVYTDGEGQLSAVTQNGDYTLTCPLRTPCRDLIADTECDPPACRLFGPRRIGLRTSVRARVRLLCRQELPAPDTEGMEVLPYTAVCRRTRVSETAELPFSDAVTVGGIAPEGLRLVLCDAAPLVEEARITEGGCRLRATVQVRILAVSEEGRPLSYTATVPLERELTCEGAEVGDVCLPTVCVTSVNVRPSGDGEGGCRLEIDGTAELSARVYGNTPLSLVRALYSPTHRIESESRQRSVERLLGAAFGNYTVSGACPIPAGEERAALILDAVALPTVRRVAEEEGRTVVSGDVRVRLLLAGAPQGDAIPCSSAEMTHPFRIECAAFGAGKEARYDLRVEATRVRGRIEEAGYAADTELSLSLAAFTEESVSAVETVTSHREERFAPRTDAVLAVYPTGEDTLWSLAERYHTTPAALAAANRLPFEGNAAAALPTSLDGVGYLLIE